MLLRYISIALLSFVACTVDAQEHTFAAETTGQNSELLTTPLPLPELKSALVPLPYSGGRSGAEVGLYATINVGADIMTVSPPNANYSGSGLYIDFGLGAAFQGGSSGRSQECSRIFSVQLNYISQAANVTVKNSATGLSSSVAYGTTYIGLPVRYTGIVTGNGRVGFYYQGGITPEYNVKAQVASTDQSSHFSKVVVVPSVGAGITFIAKATRRRRKDEQIFLGPFASYNINSMSNDSNVGIHALVIGLHYSAMVLN